MEVSWTAIFMAYLLCVMVIVYVTVVAGGRPVFGPESYFLLIGFGTLGATIHAAGTFLHPYVLFMGWGLVAFLLGVLSFSRWADFDHKEELRAFCERPFDRHLGRRQREALLALGILSLLVTVAYFLLLGSFAPFGSGPLLPGIRRRGDDEDLQ